MNTKKYNDIFISVFDIKESELDESFNFKDIKKWDSLAHMTLIGELEEAFDVLFETEDILHFGGYENGKEILKRYGVEF